VNWFVIPQPNPDAAARLFCLPYAGAGAGAYRRWPATIGPDIEVVAVQLPGRENRILEDPGFGPAEITGLADAITAHHGANDVPYAIYGHSLGGWHAFELIRHLHRTGGALPVKLYVGGCRAPHIPATGTFAGLSTVDDETLLARVASGGGLSDDVLAEPELLELLLPVLRADFTYLDQYTHNHDQLPVPIAAYAGTGDTAVTRADVQAWEQHTTAGFTIQDVDGDHFFLHDDTSRVTELITKDLLSALPGRPS
jgi:surfactin synthase thioesterase subunit